MMGTKARNVAQLSNISLEDLIPQDHLYRHLDQKLDLSFGREFVQETYAQGSRSSIDPMVFFKLQLVMFFEGIREDAGTHASSCRSFKLPVVSWVQSGRAPT